MIRTQLPWLWDNIHPYPPTFSAPASPGPALVALPPQALASFLFPPFRFFFRQRTTLPCGNAAPCPSPLKNPWLPLSNELPLSDQAQLCVTGWQVQSKQTKWILTQLCVLPDEQALKGGGGVCHCVCARHSTGRGGVQGGTQKGGLEL